MCIGCREAWQRPINRVPRACELCGRGLHGAKKQKETLHYLLRGFADPSRPVILHLRGHKGKEDEVYFRGLKIVSPCLPREQPIQLHCFSGSAVAFAKWQKRFPDVYASFSGLVSSFEDHQKQGLRAVPGDRLLLETDSPYLPTVGRGVGNSPHHVGHVAMLVSQVRQQPVLDVIELADALVPAVGYIRKGRVGQWAPKGWDTRLLWIFSRPVRP
ncbi:3'-5' ssDNA/RNA exonuclease tatd [Plakobranchus ocellatus]|uniref:3'-5' ssDNA/RNA exonuclease tatd n=1 Tax=Plakobranchus ocellatus TaxID=259542 RepID=A0AAV4BVC2_9GAST|nr:3'-5' ssDNA/RNA exonuclease tatd [Plakobranchus ocellatus]